ncbi:MAG: hypothetical protein AB7F59_03010 [Bdellovibrionales bacterium]
MNKTAFAAALLLALNFLAQDVSAEPMNPHLYQNLFGSNPAETMETIEAGKVIVSEHALDKDFLLIPVGKNNELDEKSRVVYVKSWKNINYNVDVGAGATVKSGDDTMGSVGLLTVGAGVSVLADTFTVQADVTVPLMPALGGGLSAKVTPLAALGWKYVYVSSKLYAMRYMDVSDTEHDNQVKTQVFGGFGVGIRLPKNLTVEGGRGVTKNTHEDGSKERKWGYYGVVSVTIDKGRLFK